MRAFADSVRLFGTFFAYLNLGVATGCGIGRNPLSSPNAKGVSIGLYLTRNANEAASRVFQNIANRFIRDTHDLRHS